MTFDDFMRRPLWFDKEGQPLTAEEASRLKWGDPESAATDGEGGYHRVGSDRIEGVTFNGEYQPMLWVSTVWLGFNHNYFDGPPLIFETMVFRLGDTGGEVGTMRYSTELEAQEGHQRTVACLQANERPFAWAEIGDRS